MNGQKYFPGNWSSAARRLFPASLALGLFLAACASPKASRRVDDELSRLSSSARTAFAHGSIEVAARLYGRAVIRARALDEAAEIANNDYNLAACLIILGRNDRAWTLLEESVAEFKRLGRELPEVLLLQARVARLLGQGAEAVRLAEAVVTLPRARGKKDFAALALLIKVAVTADKGDAIAARKQWVEAQPLLAGVADPLPQAEAAGLSARISLLEKKPDEAATAFDRQAELLQKGGRYREMALALGQAGAAWQQAGQAGQAADRQFRAARSLSAQGDEVGALTLIEPALTAAKAAGDEGTIRRTLALFEKIRKSVEAAKPKDAGGS